MKLLIVLSAVLAYVYARPSLIYANLIPGAPIGLDGRVVDTAEVALAKAEHAAAHINQKIDLAAEAARSADHHVLSYLAPTVIDHAHLAQPLALTTKLVPGAPIGLDGRVIDTPEVALAKAEHAAAHVNEKLGHQTAKLTTHDNSLVLLDHGAPLLHYYIH